MTDNGWFDGWMEVAKELNVNFSAIPFGPLMKAPRNGRLFFG